MCSGHVGPEQTSFIDVPYVYYFRSEPSLSKCMWFLWFCVLSMFQHVKACWSTPNWEESARYIQTTRLISRIPWHSASHGTDLTMTAVAAVDSATQRWQNAPRPLVEMSRDPALVPWLCDIWQTEMSLWSSCPINLSIYIYIHIYTCIYIYMLYIYICTYIYI